MQEYEGITCLNILFQHDLLHPFWDFDGSICYSTWSEIMWSNGDGNIINKSFPLVVFRHSELLSLALQDLKWQILSIAIAGLAMAPVLINFESVFHVGATSWKHTGCNIKDNLTRALPLFDNSFFFSFLLVFAFCFFDLIAQLSVSTCEIHQFISKFTVPLQ